MSMAASTAAAVSPLWARSCPRAQRADAAISWIPGGGSAATRRNLCIESLPLNMKAPLDTL